MITPRRLIDIQLDGFFGNMMPKKIQALVDEELNQGRWCDGYDIAVNPSGLDSSEGQELLDIVLGQYPEYKIDEERLLASVHKKLTQSAFSNVLWIAADDATFILADSLRVARYRNVTPLWITPRISFDGIELDYVDYNIVRGRAFLGESYTPDSPFILNFETGKIIEGQIIES